LKGHLAVITSAEEDAFIDQLRFKCGLEELWTEGYQPVNEVVPTANWRWVQTGEPIPGFNGSGAYSNWQVGEPNDYYGPASEQYLGIGKGGAFGWNDEGYLGNIHGYVIEYEDSEPFQVTCSAATGELWPPKHVLGHDLVNVGFMASAADNCDGVIPVSNIKVLVWSDEAELASASGNFSPDAKSLNADGTLRLRAERRGDADGRVYLIVASATDSSGNTGFCVSTVTVTHDQSAASYAKVRRQAAVAQAYAASHTGHPPPGYYAIGTGPIGSPKP
jgi:hypothetical protein